MKRSSKIILILVALALIPVVVKLQMAIDPQRQQFQPGRGLSAMKVDVGNNPVVMPSQFIAGTLFGFREVVAGLLWVRANDFFHSGNYEAIVPLIRIITWLDPHQIDVYCTGAWHLAYNFVDSSQRADWRYLAPAMAFLREGIKSNPGVYDPEFDLGFVLYDLKALNFEKAIYWESKAGSEKNVPLFVYRQIAHAYEKAGRIDDCINQWKFCIEQAAKMAKKKPKDYAPQNHLVVSKRNLDMTLLRRVLRADLSKHLVDVGFEANFKRLGPRVFVVSGKANLPEMSRIDVTLFDADYKDPEINSFTWDVDPKSTAVVDIGIHGMPVRDGKFERKFDLSKDTRQYPFVKGGYVLTIGFNPRTTSIETQDTVGWYGEGITDKRYLDTKTTPGVRRIIKVIKLKREDII